MGKCEKCGNIRTIYRGYCQWCITEIEQIESDLLADYYGYPHHPNPPMQVIDRAIGLKD